MWTVPYGELNRAFNPGPGPERAARWGAMNSFIAPFFYLLRVDPFSRLSCAQ